MGAGRNGTNAMTFVERMAGLVFALLIAIAGLGSAVYLSLQPPSSGEALLSALLLRSLQAVSRIPDTTTAPNTPPFGGFFSPAEKILQINASFTCSDRFSS